MTDVYAWTCIHITWHIHEYKNETALYVYRIKIVIEEYVIDW